VQIILTHLHGKPCRPVLQNHEYGVLGLLYVIILPGSLHLAYSLCSSDDAVWFSRLSIITLMASNSILAGPPLSVKRCHDLLPILSATASDCRPGCISGRGKPLESFSVEISSNLTNCSSHPTDSSTVYSKFQPTYSSFSMKTLFRCSDSK